MFFNPKEGIPKLLGLPIGAHVMVDKPETLALGQMHRPHGPKGLADHRFQDLSRQVHGLVRLINLANDQLPIRF